MAEPWYRWLLKCLCSCVIVSQLILPFPVKNSFLTDSVAYAREEDDEERKRDKKSPRPSAGGDGELIPFIIGLSVAEYILNSESIPYDEFEKKLESEVDPVIIPYFYKGIQTASRKYIEILDESAGDEDYARERLYDLIDRDLLFRDPKKDKNLQEIEEEDFIEADPVQELEASDGEEPKIEITRLDGEAAIRVVYDGVNHVFMGTDINTKHVDSFIARLGLNRNTIIHQLDFETGIKETRFQKKPTLLTKDWFKQYWKAIYKKPVKGELTLGFHSGVVQSSLIFAGAIALLFGLGQDKISEAMISAGVAFCFGMFFGTYVKTMKQWHLVRGNLITKVLKRSSISWGSRYIYEALAALFISGVSLSSLFFGEHAFDTHWDIIVISLLSNASKTGWYMLPEFNKKMGYGREAVEFKLFGRLYKPEYSKSDLQMQLIYLPSFLISKVGQIYRNDMMNVGYALPLVGTDASIGFTAMTIGLALSVSFGWSALLWKKKMIAQKAAKGDRFAQVELEKIEEYIVDKRREFKDMLLLKKPRKWAFETVPQYISERGIPAIKKTCKKLFLSSKDGDITF